MYSICTCLQFTINGHGFGYLKKYYWELWGIRRSTSCFLSVRAGVGGNLPLRGRWHWWHGHWQCFLTVTHQWPQADRKDSLLTASWISNWDKTEDSVFCLTEVTEKFPKLNLIEFKNWIVRFHHPLFLCAKKLKLNVFVRGLAPLCCLFPPVNHRVSSFKLKVQIRTSFFLSSPEALYYNNRKKPRSHGDHSDQLYFVLLWTLL